MSEKFEDCSFLEPIYLTVDKDKGEAIIIASPLSLSTRRENVEFRRLQAFAIIKKMIAKAQSAT